MALPCNFSVFFGSWFWLPFSVCLCVNICSFKSYFWFFFENRSGVFYFFNDWFRHSEPFPSSRFLLESKSYGVNLMGSFLFSQVCSMQGEQGIIQISLYIEEFQMQSAKLQQNHCSFFLRHFMSVCILLVYSSCT